MLVCIRMIVVTSVLLSGVLPCVAEYDLEPLRVALAQQAKYRSAVVKVRQTKQIPALDKPVKTTGKLWLRPGKVFRWQLGDPIASTAIFDGKQVYLLDEKKHTGTAYPPDHRKVKPLLLMLGIGEGASVEKMAKVFKVTGVTRHEEHYIVAFAPKSGKLKRVLKRLVLQINTQSSFMERVEWTQRDGSVVITEFYPPQMNVTLPKGIFTIQKSKYQWK